MSRNLEIALSAAVAFGATGGAEMVKKFDTSSPVTTSNELRVNLDTPKLDTQNPTVTVFAQEAPTASPLPSVSFAPEASIDPNSETAKGNNPCDPEVIPAAINEPNSSEQPFLPVESPNPSVIPGGDIVAGDPDCEVEKDEVQKALDEWLTRGPDGKWPIESTPDRFTSSDMFAILNILPNQDMDYKFKEYGAYRFQAKLITHEVVNGQLIVYLGFEDRGATGDNQAVLSRENARYYKGFTYGPLDKRFAQFSYISNDDASKGGVSDEYFPSNIDLNNKLLKKHRGEVIISQIYPYKLKISDYTGELRDKAKYVNKTLKRAQEFLRISFDVDNYEVSKRKPLSEIKIREGVINTRITPEMVKDYQVPSIQGFITKDNS